MADAWYCAVGERQFGPMSLSDLRAKLRGGDLHNLFVWCDGFDDWKRAEDVPELKSKFRQPPPFRPRGEKQAERPPTQGLDSIIRNEVPANTLKANKDGLVGIGGWLILLALGQVVGPARYFVYLFNYYTDLDSRLWTKFPLAFYGEAFLQISLLALMGYTTYLFFTKSRLFPTFFILEYAAAILLYPLDVIFSATMLSAYTGTPIETYAAKMINSDQFWQVVATIITAAIWIPYIKVSKRVANTFGRNTVGKSPVR